MCVKDRKGKIVNRKSLRAACVALRNSRRFQFFIHLSSPHGYMRSNIYVLHSERAQAGLRDIIKQVVEAIAWRERASGANHLLTAIHRFCTCSSVTGSPCSHYTNYTSTHFHKAFTPAHNLLGSRGYHLLMQKSAPLQE